MGGIVLFFVAGAASLIMLDEERNVWVTVIAVLSGWLGLSGMFLMALIPVLDTASKHDDSEEGGLEPFWFYSGGAVALKPVVDGLRDHHHEVSSKAVLLMYAEGNHWRFKAGYNCSPGVGSAVARALGHLLGCGRQQVDCINVIDGAMAALCTPFSLYSGQSCLLVSLHDAAGSVSGSVARNACHAVVELGWILGALEDGAQRTGNLPAARLDVIGTKVDQDAAACCAVCDRLRSPTGAWKRWDAWLHERNGDMLSHTICPECADWAYPGVSPVSSAARPSRA